MANNQMTKHCDVLIIGAGISGISAAHHLRERCPDKSFEILERRDDIGGTWDLFRYPGIRSDSDMYTLGFSFRPWRDRQAIADAPSIMKYLRAAVADEKLEEKIHFGKKAVAASWSSSDNKWTLTVEDKATGETEQRSCNFLHLCSGYYNYDKGYRPDFAGEENFEGPIIHPQFWPEDLDYTGKKVVVIGSGATAITLVPAMAQKAAHVTMLQRSPSYIVARPAQDVVANFLNKYLPSRLAYGIVRWRNVLLGKWFFAYCRHFPDRAKNAILKLAREEVPENFDVDKHLVPNYNPWDQRLCLAPNGDFFESLRAGTSSITTDHIENFTREGIKLKSGETLDADIVVSATGLDLSFFGNIQITVDNKPIRAGDTVNYKGMMFSGVPNLASSFGYTNASWTLRCDLTSKYVCRMLNYMTRKNYQRAMPTIEASDIDETPLLDFSSGYITRKYEELPKQGKRAPWQMYQNYVRDIFATRFSKLNDGAMIFKK